MENAFVQIPMRLMTAIDFTVVVASEQFIHRRKQLRPFVTLWNNRNMRKY